MSMLPNVIPAIPEKTMRIAHAAFPRGNMYLGKKQSMSKSSPLANHTDGHRETCGCRYRIRISGRRDGRRLRD